MLDSSTLMKRYHILCWGLPLIIVIIMFGTSTTAESTGYSCTSGNISPYSFICTYMYRYKHIRGWMCIHIFFVSIFLYMYIMFGTSTTVESTGCACTSGMCTYVNVNINVYVYTCMDISIYVDGCVYIS
jgi:hypothetical protein